MARESAFPGRLAVPGAEERGRVRGERGRGTPGSRPSSGGATRRPRELHLNRARSRAGSVVAATTARLGLSSTRRAAVLAVVVCALALTVAVPLRNYMAQRQELAAVSEQHRALASEVEELTRERDRLSDPAEVAAQARSRLGYVAPGEVPYVVQLPDAGAARAKDPALDGVPWYRQLWREVEGAAAP